MPPLSPPPLLAETRHLLAALSELYRQTDLALFPRTALALLQAAIPCAALTYNEINYRTEKVHFVIEPPEREAAFRSVERHYWKWAHQHPLTALLQPGVSAPAHAISEFLPAEKLHQLEIYREFLAVLEVEDTLMLSVTTTNCSSIFFALNRGAGQPPFHAHELELANLLKPHLVQAYDNAHLFTESRALALLARGAFDASAYGLLLVDAELNLIHRNDVAQALLTAGFGATTGRLPEPLRRWLQQPTSLAAARAPFALPGPEGRRYLLRACPAAGGGWLLAAQEQTDTSPPALAARFQLTPREGEVLHWLCHGKSNPEIGLLLGTSPRTVDKHMERVLRKLGADSRAGAIVAALSG